MKSVQIVSIIVIFLIAATVFEFTVSAKSSKHSGLKGSTIIIVRHGDKYRGKYHGKFLDPKGYVRAVRLLQWYKTKWGKAPDYIFATNPVLHGPGSTIWNKASFREIQTVAPLSNYYKMPVEHPVVETDVNGFVNILKNGEQYNGKTIFVCWDSYNIPLIVKQLGATGNVPQWPSDDFDSAYILTFTEEGKLGHIELLSNQYPVSSNVSWDSLINEFDMQY